MTALTDDAGRLRPGWAFLLSSVLACGAFFICGFASASLAGDHVLRFEAIFRTSLAVLLLSLFSWLLTVANHVESHRLAAQGLPISPGWQKQFGVGCLLGMILVLAALLPVAIWGQLSFRLIVTRHSIPHIATVLFVLLTGALAEELMFRGYPFQRLVEAIGATRAIAAFSILFGCIHLWNPGATAWGLINTVAIGVVLAMAYLRTRALWLPWGFHFAWNLTGGLVLGLPVSGLRLFNVAVHGSAAGPTWLTGGSYGMEASAPGTLAVALGLFIVAVAPLMPLPSLGGASQERAAIATDVSDSSN